MIAWLVIRIESWLDRWFERLSALLLGCFLKMYRRRVHSNDLMLDRISDICQ